MLHYHQAITAITCGHLFSRQRRTKGIQPLREGIKGSPLRRCNAQAGALGGSAQRHDARWSQVCAHGSCILAGLSKISSQPRAGLPKEMDVDPKDVDWCHGGVGAMSVEREAAPAELNIGGSIA